MVKGLKQTSSTVAIGFQVTETGPNTFTQGTVDLNLDPLNNEVFVVLAIDLNPTAPNSVAGTNTEVAASLTSTSQTAVQNLSNSNCLADSVLSIRQDPGATSGPSFARIAQESPATMLDYIGIIATNDFFVQVTGTGNTVVRGVSGKMYGYRARADASIYAALVQSEVLSA